VSSALCWLPDFTGYTPLSVMTAVSSLSRVFVV